MAMPDVYGDADSMIPERDQRAIQSERSVFLVRVYGHLVAALFALVGLEAIFFNTAIGDHLWSAFVGLPWLVFLGGFLVIGWIATRFAHSVRSKPLQYLGLSIYVIGNAVILFPLLVIAQHAVGTSIIGEAAAITLIGFLGLTAIVLMTRKDFSFLRPLVAYGMLIALVGIGASLIFGFTLGIWFSVLMIGLAGAAILYDTSNILRNYPSDRYVAASLSLFASLALMFWYVLQLLISLNSD